MFSWNNVQYMFVSRSQFNQKNISANVFPNKICENSGEKRKVTTDKKRKIPQIHATQKIQVRNQKFRKTTSFRKKHNIEKIK